MTNNWSKEVQEVSIPRRVLRGFRVGGAEALHVRHLAVHGFNTPEGVEGFSRNNGPTGEGQGRSGPGFNTPEGVEGFSSFS